MSKIHRLLQRQLKKFLPDYEQQPAAIRDLIGTINQSYHHFEENRELVERAMRLSSDELYEKNIQLSRESGQQKLLIESLKDAIHSISPEEKIVHDNDLINIAGILKEAVVQRKRMEQDLIQAREAAEGSLETRKLFLANVSHEIRTPINAISGMAAILNEGHLSPTQREYLKAIRSASDGLMVIVNDILDVSKLESGRFSIENIPFDLNALGTPLVQSMSLKAAENGVRFEWSQDSRIHPLLVGDPTRLNQVLVNLISNALKFTHEGIVSVNLKLTSETMKYQTILFEVVDTGIGIYQEKIAEIFEQFSQEDASTTRKYGGTGLGLTISRSLVEMMGGKLNAESKKNAGSRFFFTLNFEKARHVDENHASIFTNKDLKRTSILLVEDNELNRFLAITLLKKWNALVDSATNGLEAIKFLKENQVDLILMDLQMPEMGGFETTRIIRDVLNLKAPIIALTANTDENEKVRCINEGMNDYIAKPFQPEALYRVIFSHIQHNNKIAEPEKHLYSLNKLNAMYDGNAEHIKKTTEIFVRQAENDLRQIQEAMLQHNFPEIKNMAHKMKSNIELFEIEQLIDDVPIIEELAIARDLEALEPKIERLSTIIKSVSKSLSAQVINTIEPDNEKTP